MGLRSAVTAGALAAAALAAFATTTPRTDRRPLGDLTGPWQLFVDDALVSERTGAARVYHAFKKEPRNPVLVADRPWEGSHAYLYGTVLGAEDGRGYRMWYHASAGEYRNLYAVSSDGIRWEKPSLGLVEYEGSRENNILFRRTREDHMPQVIATPWETDPARRYKLVNYDYGRTKPDHLVSGFWGALSPDGIHWKEVPANPILADPGDVGHFVWDAHSRQYLGYPKTFAPVRGYRRRAVGYSATRVFEAFPPAELILVPDAADDRWVTADFQHTDFYGLSAFAYEAGYIGFLWIFRITDGLNDGPIHAELVSSRDGLTWVRQEGERTPILPLGPSGAWDSGMVFTATQPLVEGEQLKLYYGGFDSTHSAKAGKGAVGLATLRKDGFASLDAGPGEAAVTTVALRGARGGLAVNADVRGGGWLRVEVLDAAGRVLPGFGREDCMPVTASGVDQLVLWRERRELPDRPGPVRLRFVFRDASLYAFRAGPELAPEPAPARELALPFEGAKALDGLVVNGRVALRPDSDLGSTVALFSAPGDTIDIPNTSHLGREFTLGARVRTANRRLTRIFSTYRGTGEPASGELLFDINPASGVVRFVAGGQRVQSRPHFFADGLWHHFAATYRGGRVELYLDGRPAGSGELRPGSAHLFHDRSILDHFGPPGARSLAGVHLATDLRVGEDQGGRFVTYQDEAHDTPAEQLIGAVDDLLVAWRAYSAEEVLRLAGRRP